MTQSLTQTNIDSSLLTPKETAWFLFTRCLIFLISVGGVVWSLFDPEFINDAFIVILISVVANFAWHSRFAWEYPPRSSSIQGKRNRPLLAAPQFCIPIIEHIVRLYERHSKRHSDDTVQSLMVRIELSSSAHPNRGFQRQLVKLQNHVAVAFVTSCCQIYLFVAYFLYLLGLLG